MVPTNLDIFDKPLFGHRGVLLDTSRNFYPVRDLKRTIEAMAMNKLNVFHWHITDSQSFPIFLPSVPEVAEKGAYSSDMMYSVADVKSVVRFAMRRGVRVVPEFDAPGWIFSSSVPPVFSIFTDYFFNVSSFLFDQATRRHGAAHILRL